MQHNENFDFLSLSTLEEAKKVWEQYFKELDEFYKKNIPKNKEPTVKEKSSADSTSQFAIQMAKVKANAIAKAENNTKAVLIDPDKLIENNNLAFLHLMHGHPVKEATDIKSIDNFKKIVEAGKFWDSIFDSMDAYYLIAALGARGEKEGISTMQAETLLDFIQNKKEFDGLQAIELIDDKGNFTDGADKLFQALNERRYFEPLSSQQKKDLSLLLLALPKTERFFFMINEDPLVKSLQKDSTIEEFYNPLKYRGAIIFSAQKNKHYFLSSGLREALGMVYFGPKDHIKFISAFGEFIPNEIGEGMRDGIRLACLRNIGIDPFTDIHNHKDLLDFLARVHDYYHTLVVSFMGKDILNLFVYMSDVIKQETKFSLSQEMWNWKDADFIRNIDMRDADKLNDQQFTDRWCLFIEGERVNEGSKINENNVRIPSRIPSFLNHP